MIDLHSPHDCQRRRALARGRCSRGLARSGVTTLAVTDHDTVEGLARAAAAAEAEGIRFVPGIEVSAYADGREIHILGHFVEPAEPGLARSRTASGTSAPSGWVGWSSECRPLGFPVTLEEVEAHRRRRPPRPATPGAGPGRARATSPPPARPSTASWVTGSPGYVDRFRVSAEDAIADAPPRRWHRHHRPPGLEQGGATHAGEAGARRAWTAWRSSIPTTSPASGRRSSARPVALGLVPTAGSDYHGAAGDAGPEPGDGVARTPRTSRAWRPGPASRR